MAFGHGIGKIPPSDGFVGGVEKLGLPIPIVFAWMAGLSEFFGGLLIALGLFTRPAAFFWICTMGIAAFIRHAEDPFASKEKALLFLTVGLCLLFTGAGKFSLGKMLFKQGVSRPFACFFEV